MSLQKLKYYIAFNNLVIDNINWLSNEYPYQRVTLVKALNYVYLTKDANTKLLADNFIKYAGEYFNKIFEMDETFFLGVDYSNELFPNVNFQEIYLSSKDYQKQHLWEFFQKLVRLSLVIRQ
jgi:hypothetical protein